MPNKSIKFDDTATTTDDRDKVIVVKDSVPTENRVTLRQLETQLKAQQDAVKATEAQLSEYKTALNIK